MSRIHIEGDVSGQVGQGGTVVQVQGDPGRAEAAPIVILFWASNPIDTDRLRLDEEVRTIDERLRASDFRDRFDLQQQWAVRIGDLSEGLLRHRPAIVHFSGHGNPSGEIALERPDGTAGPVSTSALAGLFAAVGDDGQAPRVVVFNACYSEDLAEAVARHVDCVVGTTTSIGDQAAIAFAAGFYRALGYGRSVASAVELGRNEIALYGLGEEATPKLVSRRVDPGTVRLVEAESTGIGGEMLGDTFEEEPVAGVGVGEGEGTGRVGSSPPPRGGDGADRTADLGPSRDEPVTEVEDEEAEEEPWNLQTRFPRQVVAGSVTPLLVELVREAGTGPHVSTLPVELAPGTEVGVVIQVKEGFEIEGPAEGKLKASDDPLPLRFRLRATAEGSGMIRVLFFVEATALGAITLEPAILPPDAGSDETAVPRSEVLSALSVGSARPDLELLVLEEAGAGRPTYSIRVTAADESMGIHLREFGPIELHTDARSYFAEMFRDNEALELNTVEDRARAQRLLESKGSHLFSTLLPPALQTLLWDIRDRIVRIRVDSEEPFIPWELIRLSGPDDDGVIVEGRFLCEYEVTRWIPGLGLNSRLTMTDFGVVVPQDSGLASAQEEKEFLAGLADGRRRVTSVPARFDDLLNALAAGVHDVWHFSGHGSAKDDRDPNRSVMVLGDGQRLTPEQISGRQANLGRAHPLVFLNACQIGRAGMSLTGLGGWAQQFLSVGAAGFVGAMWNVHDNPARDFAKSFYTRLLEGDTIGTATLTARNDIKQYQDATWLAYTVYGHPSAALVEQGE